MLLLLQPVKRLVLLFGHFTCPTTLVFAASLLFAGQHGIPPLIIWRAAVVPVLVPARYRNHPSQLTASHEYLQI